MGKRQTTSAREQRKIKARAARFDLKTRKVLRTKPKAADEMDLVDAPRGYVFTVLTRGRAHLMEIGKPSTLCALRSKDMRFAPRRDGGAMECSGCRKVWTKRERYGHPAELERNAQAFDEVLAHRVATAAATGS